MVLKAIPIAADPQFISETTKRLAAKYKINESIIRSLATYYLEHNYQEDSTANKLMKSMEFELDRNVKQSKLLRSSLSIEERVTRLLDFTYEETVVKPDDRIIQTYLSSQYRRERRKKLASSAQQILEYSVVLHTRFPSPVTRIEPYFHHAEADYYFGLKCKRKKSEPGTDRKTIDTSEGEIPIYQVGFVIDKGIITVTNIQGISPRLRDIYDIELNFITSIRAPNLLLYCAINFARSMAVPEIRVMKNNPEVEQGKRQKIYVGIPIEEGFDPNPGKPYTVMKFNQKQ